MLHADSQGAWHRQVPEPSGPRGTLAKGVLLVSCPADSGLVMQLVGFVQRQGGQIVGVDHHLDQDTRLSFSRIEWELSGFRLAPEEVERAFRKVACCDRATWRISFSHRPVRTAIWVSRQEHCLTDLLSRHRDGELNADIQVVMSNHTDLEPIADRFGLEYLHFPIAPETKTAQERRQLAVLKERGIELVVLARYMRIVGKEIVDLFPQQIINIHHAFLPAFPGARPYERAHERGVKLIGATAHYVTEALDEGPIIEQDVVRTTHAESVPDLISKGRDLERIVLARAVRLHLDNRIGVCGNKTVVFG